MVVPRNCQREPYDHERLRRKGSAARFVSSRTGRLSALSRHSAGSLSARRRGGAGRGRAPARVSTTGAGAGARGSMGSTSRPGGRRSAGSHDVRSSAGGTAAAAAVLGSASGRCSATDRGFRVRGSGFRHVRGTFANSACHGAVSALDSSDAGRAGTLSVRFPDTYLAVANSAISAAVLGLLRGKVATIDPRRVGYVPDRAWDATPRRHIMGLTE
jgi:hypothetical protein